MSGVAWSNGIQMLHVKTNYSDFEGVSIAMKLLKENYLYSCSESIGFNQWSKNLWKIILSIVIKMLNSQNFIFR